MCFRNRYRFRSMQYNDQFFQQVSWFIWICLGSCIDSNMAPVIPNILWKHCNDYVFNNATLKSECIFDRVDSRGGSFMVCSRSLGPCFLLLAWDVVFQHGIPALDFLGCVVCMSCVLYIWYSFLAKCVLYTWYSS